MKGANHLLKEETGMGKPIVPQDWERAFAGLTRAQL